MPLTFYALELPDETAWQRIRGRKLEPGVLPIAEGTFTRLKPRFEPLELGEIAVKMSPRGADGWICPSLQRPPISIPCAISTPSSTRSKSSTGSSPSRCTSFERSNVVT